MGRDENRAYMEAIRSRYRHAGRTGKSKILDEFCALCGYQRKYAIRLLGTVPKQSRRRPGRQSQYRQPRLLEALRRIWLATDQMCGKRLVAAIPLWLPHDETRYGALESLIRSRLLSASAATLDRLLRPPFVSTIPKASRRPAPARCSTVNSPSAPSTGISLSLVSSRPTPLRTAAIRLPVIESGA